MGLTSTYASILAMASVAVAQQCPLAFDGRVPAGSTPTFFDTDASPFGTKFVKGANITFGELIKIPDVPASLFDTAGNTIAYEVTLSDKSIFAPSADNVQIGFRRAELQIDTNNGSDSSTLGVKTLHFTIRKDPARLFNNSHEYQLVFLEDATFSTNQFVLKTGFLYDQPAGSNPDSLVLVGNTNKPLLTLFNTSFTPDVNHNFGITLDFVANQVTVFYSTDNNPLVVVNGPVANNISGQGQYHFGALKKPTGVGLTDITKQGFQPTGIDEGVIYSGLFMEDSTGGCVSLSGSAATAPKTTVDTGAGVNSAAPDVDECA